MSYRVLPADEAFWRPSNQMGVMNTDLAKQLDADTVGARMWRLQPGQSSTRHRHAEQSELYAHGRCLPSLHTYAFRDGLVERVDVTEPPASD